MINPIKMYYIANWLYRKHVPFIPRIIQLIIFLFFNAVIPYKTSIGKNCIIAHGGSGVVINEKATIGDNVLICQQVTIGGTGIGQSLPLIENDVYLGAGAKIIGPVIIGNNSVIGANAVVTKSIPPRCVAAGVPARIIRENVSAHDVEVWR